MAVSRVQSSLAESTLLSYRSGWFAFFRFCLAYEWNPHPPSQELFLRFATWLWLCGYAYSTIKTYLGSLPSLYIAVGIEVTLAKTQFPALGRCMRGIRRVCEGPKSKAHLTIQLLVQFRPHVDLYAPKHLALWSALCVGFFSFLRSGNLVPKLKNSWKPGTHLSRGDVRFTERGAVLLLRFTKTSQFDGPPIEVPIPYIPGAVFCPVTALKCLFTCIKRDADAPLFSYGRDAWITYSDLSYFIRALASRCELNPSDYGCHSSRSGGATFASASGGLDYHIKLQGLWKSDAFLRYLRLSLDQRWHLPDLMATAARETVM